MGLMSLWLMSFIIFLVCGFDSYFLINIANNFLVEDPSRISAAEDVSVDILFAAFEKFLKVAWSEHMGPLLPPNIIQSMQSTFGMLWRSVSEMCADSTHYPDSGRRDEFTKHFKQCLEDMTPQNKRALVAIVKLLSE